MENTPKMITLEQLIDLAKAAETNNPIEWGELPINEERVYTIFAQAVYSAFSKQSIETRTVVMLASLIKLNVENFVLNQQNLHLQKTILNLQNNRG